MTETAHTNTLSPLNQKGRKGGRRPRAIYYKTAENRTSVTRMLENIEGKEVILKVQVVVACGQ